MLTLRQPAAHRSSRLLAARLGGQLATTSIYGASGWGSALASLAPSLLARGRSPMYHTMVDFSEKYLER